MVSSPLRIKQLAPALLACLLISGCANYAGMDPNLQPREITQLEGTRALPNEGGQWPQQTRWVERFGGKPLLTLVEEAYANNPGLQIVFARLEQANALAGLTNANRNPSLSILGTANYIHIPDNMPLPIGKDQWVGAIPLIFQYDIDFWGKHKSQFEAALSQVKSAEAQQANARLLLATGVTQTWLRLAQLGAQLDLIRQQTEAMQKLQSVYQLRFDAGLGTHDTLTRNRTTLSALHYEKSRIQEQIALTRNQLAALLGKGPDRALDIPLPTLPSCNDAKLPDNLSLALLARRPDIVAARWMVEANQKNIDSAKAAFYPNVNLMAVAGLGSLGLNHLFESGSSFAAVSPVISLPIFEGGRLRAQLAREDARYDEAVATYNQSLTDALHEVADSVTSLRANAQQLAAVEAGASQAEKTWRIAQQRQEVGITNLLPVYDAQIDWLDKRKQLLDVQTRQQLLEVALVKAIGGGFDANTDTSKAEQAH